MARVVMALLQRLLQRIRGVASRRPGVAAHGVAKVDDNLIRDAGQTVAALLAGLGSTAAGLSETEAASRLQRVGPNQVATERHLTVLQELAGRARNPLNFLLAALASISWLTGDLRAAIVIIGMVVLSVGLSFVQEHRSNRAAAQLRALVKTHAAVQRIDASGSSTVREVPLDTLVPGDIVHLAAGDLVPGDVRLLEAKDLHINQSALTGEAMPVEKSEATGAPAGLEAFDLPNLAFMGSNVLSGSATAVILRTGAATAFGQLAGSMAGTRPTTDFDRGIAQFTWLMLTLMAVMVPAVLLANGLTKGNWLEAVLFALAVAVGLTPEMLPMIVTVNLAKGAMAMAAKRVIVKRLNAIQNFGAMDVLCTDKTGTLTQDRIILQYHLDFEGEESLRTLEYAWLNSRFQSGLRNLLDEAILQHAQRPEHAGLSADYIKVDEMPFDFQRRRMSVVLARPDGRHLLITKGAVEEIFAVCDHYVLGDSGGSLDPQHFEDAKAEMERLNGQGFRVVAVAFREVSAPQARYSVDDEAGMTLLGYVAFLDPPKESVPAALRALAAAGVRTKILTGDNGTVTRTICRQVGLPTERILLGHEIAAMTPAALAEAVETTHVFAKLAPAQKAEVIAALRANGHVVGFLGDGINDGPALRAADVGVSVDTAVDIAKESADIILLEKSLLVLCEGVIEGRRIFANITKYIKMGASSNFGNMFSVLGASLFLPFLPMAPIQVLTNNLLYDFSQTTIPTDNVDPEYLAVPRRWDIGNLTRFVLLIGPISSIFDYATFGLMLYGFGAWTDPGLFQAGWFVESLMTQTLIIHIIRTARIPFLQSRASAPLIATTIIICAIGAAIPYTPLGATLGFKPLPALYWPCLLAMMIAYAALTHTVKSWFVRRWGM
ncbi:MAG: magnesium-translocating P-type ATPase [Alphaproteobacteria bacterium]|nr:magnesium-translocating P-type ATPase [Alphaproteobacteria bacterium]